MGVVPYFGGIGPVDGTTVASNGGGAPGGHWDGGHGVFSPFLVAVVGGFVDWVVGLDTLERPPCGAFRSHRYLFAVWV